MKGRKIKRRENSEKIIFSFFYSDKQKINKKNDSYVKKIRKYI